MGVPFWELHLMRNSKEFCEQMSMLYLPEKGKMISNIGMMILLNTCFTEACTLSMYHSVDPFSKWMKNGLLILRKQWKVREWLFRKLWMFKLLLMHFWLARWPVELVMDINVTDQSLVRRQLVMISLYCHQDQVIYSYWSKHVFMKLNLSGFRKYPIVM